MAGGGYYPIMSDTEWARAPWNEPDARECPYCDGTGIAYDDVECLECNGTGEVYD